MKNKYKQLPEEVRAIIEILLIGTISVTLVYFGILK
jgi:hypothetical protein